MKEYVISVHYHYNGDKSWLSVYLVSSLMHIHLEIDDHIHIRPISKHKNTIFPPTHKLIQNMLYHL